MLLEPIPFFLFSSLPNVLCNPTYVIWSDNWSHSLYYSPSWGFLWVFSAVRWMSGDMCTAPGFISLLPLSLVKRLDWNDTRDKCYWYDPGQELLAHLHQPKAFWMQSMALWTVGYVYRTHRYEIWMLNNYYKEPIIYEYVKEFQNFIVLLRRLLEEKCRPREIS